MLAFRRLADVCFDKRISLVSAFLFDDEIWAGALWEVECTAASFKGVVQRDTCSENWFRVIVRF